MMDQDPDRFWKLLVSFRLAASSVHHHRLIQWTESFVSNENTLPNLSFLLLYSKCLLKMRNWPQFPFSGHHTFTVINQTDVFSSSQVSKDQYCAGHQQSTEKWITCTYCKFKILHPEKRKLPFSVDRRHRLKCIWHQGPKVKHFTTRLSRLINRFPTCLWFGCQNWHFFLKVLIVRGLLLFSLLGKEEISLFSVSSI